MMVAGSSSLVPAYLHQNYFLLMAGVFTLCMVGSGQLYLKHKNQNVSQVIRLEWTITLLMLLSGLWFIGMGNFSVIKSNWFGLTLIIFGILGLRLVLQDFRNYNRQSTLINYWLLPTFIFTPLIIKWSGKYEVKKKPNCS